MNDCSRQNPAYRPTLSSFSGLGSVFIVPLKAQKLPDNYCGSILASILIFIKKAGNFR